MPDNITLLRSAGVTVAVDAQVDWVRSWLVAATGQGEGPLPTITSAPDVTVRFENGTPPSPQGMRLVTRGTWVDRDGRVLMTGAGGSGFTQRWAWQDNHLAVKSWWSPLAGGTAANHALPPRSRPGRANVLLHHPVLWRAALSGLAPLHVSALSLEGSVALLAGPGGVGKSTLVASELGKGAVATCDNLATSDGLHVHGLREPLRLPVRPAPSSDGGPPGPAYREYTWDTWVPSLAPDVIVVIKRGNGSQPRLRPTTRAVARRALVAGTYSAGELQQFWSLCAVLALASEESPMRPDIEHVADELVNRLPCFELTLGDTPMRSLGKLLSRRVSTCLEASTEADADLV